MAEKQITLSKLRESFKTSPVQFPDSEDSMGEIIVKLFDTKIINEVHLSGSVKAKTFTIYNECQVQLQKIIPVAMDTTLARLTLPPPPSGLPSPSPPLPPQPTDEYTKLSCLMERSESIMENSFQMMKGMTESFYSTNEHSYKECEFKCRCIKCGWDNHPINECTWAEGKCSVCGLEGHAPLLHEGHNPEFRFKLQTEYGYEHFTWDQVEKKDRVYGRGIQARKEDHQGINLSRDPAKGMRRTRWISGKRIISLEGKKWRDSRERGGMDQECRQVFIDDCGILLWLNYILWYGQYIFLILVSDACGSGNICIPV